MSLKYSPYAAIPARSGCPAGMGTTLISVPGVPPGDGRSGRTAGSRWTGIRRRHLCRSTVSHSIAGVDPIVPICSAHGWKGRTVPGPSGSVTASFFKEKPPFFPWRVSWTLLPVLPGTEPIASRITASGSGWPRRGNDRSYSLNPSRSFLPSDAVHSVIIPWLSVRGPA